MTSNIQCINPSQRNDLVLRVYFGEKDIFVDKCYKIFISNSTASYTYKRELNLTINIIENALIYFYIFI